MPSGGLRRGAGRPKGAKQVRSSGLSIRRAKASGQILPLDFLLQTMNDPNMDHRDRMAAAIAAAPYVHPKLATVQVKGELSDTRQMGKEISEALKSLSELARNRNTNEPILH